MNFVTFFIYQFTGLFAARYVTAGEASSVCTCSTGRATHTVSASLALLSWTAWISIAKSIYSPR